MNTNPITPYGQQIPQFFSARQLHAEIVKVEKMLFRRYDELLTDFIGHHEATKFEMERTYAKLRKLNSNLGRRNKELEDEIANLGVRNNILQDDIEELEITNESLKDKIELNNKLIITLQNLVQVMAKKDKALHEKLEGMRKSKEDLEEEVEMLHDEFADLKAKRRPSGVKKIRNRSKKL